MGQLLDKGSTHSGKVMVSASHGSSRHGYCRYTDWKSNDRKIGFAISSGMICRSGAFTLHLWDMFSYLGTVEYDCTARY